MGQQNGEDTQDPPPSLSQIKQTIKANLYKKNKNRIDQLDLAVNAYNGI